MALATCVGLVRGTFNAAIVRGTISAAPLSRTLYVRASSNPSSALEKLTAKAELEGIEKRLTQRRRYVKPHLQRQLNARNAIYNKAKQQRIKLVEELLLQSPL
jgi:hypothetical protein